jgi:hypothetical protein
MNNLIERSPDAYSSKNNNAYCEQNHFWKDPATHVQDPTLSNIINNRRFTKESIPKSNTNTPRVFRYNGRPPLAGAFQVAFSTQDYYARESVSGISLVGTITCIRKGRIFKD